MFFTLGWQVDIVTSTYGKTLSFELEKYKSNPAFRIISDKQGTLADAYSLVWVYKGFIAQKLLPVLETLTGTAPVIFRHFYDYHDIYMPWGAELENQLASLSLSLSPVVSERLLQNGLLSSQIAVLPFTVPPHSVAIHLVMPAPRSSEYFITPRIFPPKCMSCNSN